MNEANEGKNKLGSKRAIMFVLRRLVKECVTSTKPDVVVFQKTNKNDICKRFIRSIVGHCLDDWVSFLADG